MRVVVTVVVVVVIVLVWVGISVVIIVVVAGGAVDGGGGAAGGVGEGVGFFAGATVVWRGFGSDHVEGLRVEAALWGKRLE